MKYPSIGVVLVNYNGEADTVMCVESLLKSAYRNIIVYIVDNNSPDCSGVNLKKRFGHEVRVLLMENNAGFGAANNAGMEAAFSEGCEYVLVLNNDTVVDPQMISELATYSNSNTVTVPLMVYYDHPTEIWFGGGCFDKFSIPRHEHYRQHIASVEEGNRIIEFASGCCMLLSKTAYEATAGFEASYFLYWEDVDLSLKLKHAGFNILFVPSARLKHRVSASTGGEASPSSLYYSWRNRLYVVDKFNLGFLAKAWVVLGTVKWCLYGGSKGRLARRAYLDYLHGVTGQVDLSVKK